MQPIVVLGAGGHGREAIDLVGICNADQERYELIGVLDDNPSLHGRDVRSVPVLGAVEWLANAPKDTAVVCAVGNPSRKRRAVLRAEALGARWATLIHPNVARSSTMEVGNGVMITSGCIITTDVRLGDHVHINIGSTISHDCVIRSFATIAPGVNLAGNVTVEEGCDIGIGATILQGVTVGRWSLVGAGGVVVRDIPPNTTSVGVPASVIKERPEGWHEVPQEA